MKNFFKSFEGIVFTTIFFLVTLIWMLVVNWHSIIGFTDFMMTELEKENIISSLFLLIITCLVIDICILIWLFIDQINNKRGK
jgi:hypothetical protein